MKRALDLMHWSSKHKASASHTQIKFNKLWNPKIVIVNMMLSTLQPHLYTLKRALGTTVFVGKEQRKQVHRMSDSKKFRTDTYIWLYLRRSGPTAASSLCVCQSGTWRQTQHSTAQDGTAWHSTARQGTSPPQPQILTRFRLLVHCQHYSPGHTASAHTPARKA